MCSEVYFKQVGAEITSSNQNHGPYFLTCSCTENALDLLVSLLQGSNLLMDHALDSWVNVVQLSPKFKQDMSVTNGSVVQGGRGTLCFIWITHNHTLENFKLRLETSKVLKKKKYLVLGEGVLQTIFLFFLLLQSLGLGNKDPITQWCKAKDKEGIINIKSMEL